MALIDDAIAHADAILTAAKAAIDAETNPATLVSDRPAMNLLDRIKAEIDAAAANEDWGDLAS